jgi:hypothetical protein
MASMGSASESAWWESEAWRDYEVEMQSAWRRHHKPDNEMPGSVAVEALLGPIWA